MQLAIRSFCRKSGLTRKVEVVDGYQWHYLDSEPGVGTASQKPVLVLVHGFGSNKESWLLLAARLKKYYRLIMPDLPNFGENHRQAELDCSTTAQAARLHNFLQQLELGPVHLAGLSMGGFISGRYALAYPDFLRSLTFIDSAGIDEVQWSDLRIAIEDGRNLLAADSMEDVDELLRLVAYKPAQIPSPFKREFLRELREDAELLDRIFWTVVKEYLECNLTTSLHQLQMPVLALWGRHDRVVDVSVVETLKAHIPQLHSTIFENAGHAPTVECAAESAVVLKEFIDQTSPS